MKAYMKQLISWGAIIISFYTADTVGMTITAPGVYRLSADIAGTITIAASNVTLDLNSKKIIGASVGVSCANQTDITIQNGILQNNTEHILITSCTNVTIENVDFIGGQTGVLLQSVESGAIDNCSLRSLSSNGIFLQTCSLIQCTNLEFYENTVSSVLTCSFSNAVIFDTIEVAHNTFNQFLNVPEFLPQSYIASIFITNSNDVQLNNCSLTNNFYTENNVIIYPLPICGIEVFKSDTRIQTCVFSNNNATVESPFSLAPFTAINIDAAFTVEINNLECNTNNLFASPPAAAVSAVTVNGNNVNFSATNTQNLTITNCMCSGNQLQQGGNCDPFLLGNINNCVISDCLVTTNSGTESGIFASFIDSLTINSCTISNNTGTSSRGFVGIFAVDVSAATIQNNVIQNNTDSSLVVGIFVQNTPYVALRNNLCNFNTSTGSTSTGIQGISLTGGIAAVSRNQCQGHTTNFDFTSSGIMIPLVVWTASSGAFSAPPTPSDNIDVR